MAIDDRTANRSYQLPNAGNQLVEDVARLRAALQAIDADVFARYTKTEVDTLINGLIQGAPGALDTLNELAAAMGDDPNFAATVTNLLALKANIADVYTKAQADARYVQGSTQTEMVFIATANQSVFTLSTAVINKPSALVTVDGVVQPTSEYSLNQTGTTLTLSEGVPVGTIVRVLALGVASQGAPADDTVTEPKLRDEAVTTPKMAPGAVTPEKLSQPLTLETAKTATGTAVDFTNLPSWVNRVTVMLNGISTNGASGVVVRLGTSSSFETTDYFSSSTAISSSGAAAASETSGINAGFAAAGAARAGSITIQRFAGNAWIYTGLIGDGAAPGVVHTAGVKALAGALTRLRVTSTNGTDQFDAGTVNILYE